MCFTCKVVIVHYIFIKVHCSQRKHLHDCACLFAQQYNTGLSVKLTKISVTVCLLCSQCCLLASLCNVSNCASTIHKRKYIEFPAE